MQRIYIVVLHYSSLPPSDRRFTTQFSHPLNNFFHHICQHTTMIKGKSTRFNDVDWASLKPSRKSLIKLFRNVKCSYTFEGGPNGVIFTLTYRRGNPANYDRNRHDGWQKSFAFSSSIIGKVKVFHYTKLYRTQGVSPNYTSHHISLAVNILSQETFSSSSCNQFVNHYFKFNFSLFDVTSNRFLRSPSNHMRQ